MKKFNELQSYLTRLRGLMLTLIILCSIGVGNVWATEVALTQAEIQAATAQSSYPSTEVNVSSSSGTWHGKMIINTATGFVQIRKNSANNYCGSPTFGGTVTKVVITTCNSTAADATIYLRENTTTAQPTSGTYGSGTTGSVNGTVTINVTGSPTSFYIYSSKAVYMSSITVTYSGGKTDPTASFSNGTYTIGGSALNLSTLWTSNSDGAVTYTVTSAGGTGASISTASFTATTAGSCTVKASQAATASYNAIEKSATITVQNPTCATPTFSPAAGTYVGTQTVTLATVTEGANIYYTTNGSAPTSSSTLYTTPFSVSSTTTIKAIAIKSNYANSDVASATYTITPAHTVTWKNQGASVTTTNVADGSKPVFPDMSLQSGCGKYTYFYGWAEDVWSGEVSSPGTSSTVKVYKTASEMPNVTGDGVVYHAVWGDSPGGWTKVSSVSVGDVIVITDKNDTKELTGIYMPASTHIGKAEAFTTTPNGTFPLSVVTGYNDTGVAFKNGDDYLFGSSSNDLSSTTTLAELASWTLSYDGVNDDWSITNNNQTTRRIRYNGSTSPNRFCTYTSAQTGIHIWKQSASAKCITTCCNTLAAPANPGETPNSTGAVLTWDAVSGATGYEVKIDGGAWTSTGNGTTTGYTITGKACGGTSVSWQVRATGDGSTNCEKGAASTARNFTTTACACTAPDSVDISGRWDRFGGETISLTATPYDDSGNEITTGITGYQWQKLVSTTWTDVTGANVSGAKSNNLVITNCTADNSGKYRCVISTGATCSTASATATDGSEGHGVKVYVLECYTGGTTVYNFTRIGDTQAGTVQVPMNTANTGYTFKVHADNDYYGNNGTVNKDETNWVMCNNSATECTTNLTVNSGLGGTFTFTMDYSTGGHSSVLGEPEISVTYPRKTIYLIPNSDWLSNSAKFAYYYYGVSGTGWTDFIAADACGMSADIPQWNGIKVIAVRFNPSDATPGWNGDGHVWNQTDDIVLEAGKNLITITGWSNSQTYTAYSVPTYTITFAGNGNTSGSMTNVTGIPCGEDRTLAANAFVKTGYTFANWKTNVAITVGGSPVAANGNVANQATINNITSNITLTAQWNVNSYNLTWNLGGGTTTSAGTGIESGVSVNKTTSVAYGTSLTAPTVTKTGYTFASWSPNVPAKMPDADATYAAQWNVVNYTITYNLNSGTNPGGAPTGYNIESSAITLPTPTRTGYTFGGWYLNSSFTGDVQTTIAAGSTGNKEYWAKWIANSYNLTWNLGGGTTTSAGTGIESGVSANTTTSVAYGTSLEAPTVTREGYTFSSWSPIVASTMPAAATTYTAQWTPNEYTVTWKVNGSNYSAGGSTSVNHGSKVTTLPTAPDPGDYCGDVFVGWTDATDGAYVHGTSNLYKTASEFPEATGNQIFYAVFADYAE